MRKSRIVHWVICLIIAFGFLVGEGWLKQITTEKTALYVYAPENMELAFKRALKSAGLKDTYKIVITEDSSKANILVETDKEFESEYTKIAYSPFVVVYSSADKNIKNMLKSGLLENAFFDDGYKEINFNVLIKEVVEDGKWENLGLSDMGNIKVYYPAPRTQYYRDYYDFMLVTVNNGIYPNSEEDMKKAMEQIDRFERSNYTEAVSDFEEKLNRTGGFMKNTLFLIPEVLAIDLSKSNSEYGCLFYPTITVYTNFYVKADELGCNLVNVFDDPDTFYGNFYDYIEDEGYRNSWDYSLCSDGVGKTKFLDGERDVYNVLHLEEDRIRPEDLGEMLLKTPNT